MFDLLCLTDRTLCREPFLDRVAAIAAARPAALILREKDLPEQLHAPGRDARLAAGGEDVSQSDICAAQGLSLPGLLQRVAGGSKLGKTGPDRFVQAPEGGHGQMEGVRTQGQGGLRMVMEDAGDPGLTAQG